MGIRKYNNRNKLDHALVNHSFARPCVAKLLVRLAIYSTDSGGGATLALWTRLRMIELKIVIAEFAREPFGWIRAHKPPVFHVVGHVVHQACLNDAWIVLVSSRTPSRRKNKTSGMTSTMPRAISCMQADLALSGTVMRSLGCLSQGSRPRLWVVGCGLWIEVGYMDSFASSHGVIRQAPA